MAEPTLEALEKKRLESLRSSASAIRSHPEVYREIKAMLRRVLGNPLDVSDYDRTARRLSDLLQILAEAGRETFFSYYSNHIDPRREGDTRYLRAMCQDLSDQLDILQEWRGQLRNIRIVK